MACGVLIYLQRYVKFEAARLASTLRLRVTYPPREKQLSTIYCSCNFERFDANFAQHVLKVVRSHMFKFGKIPLK